MASSTHAAWEQRIANETNPVKKSILIRAFDKMKEQERLGVAKFDPSLVQGGRPQCIAALPLYVEACEASDICSRDKKFSKTSYTCSRRCLPFVEVTPVDGKIIVTDDLSAILFELPKVSEWAGGKKAIISCTGKISVTMMKRAPVAPGWYIFGGFSVEQKRGNSDGVLYTNINCQSVEPWAQAPSFQAIHRLCCKLWGNDRYMPRPIDPKFYPPQELVNEIEQELQNEKRSKADEKRSKASSSSTDEKKDENPDDEDSKVDYELYTKAFGRAFDRHMQNLGVDWQQHDELRQQAPNSRHPYVIPLVLGDSARAMMAGTEQHTMIEHQDVFFSGDIRIKKGGNEVKVFEPSGKNPFTLHLSAAATTSVMRVDMDSGDVSTLTLAFSFRGSSFFHHIGVVDPFVAQGVLPRVLARTPMTVIGSPNMQNTRDKDSNGDDAARTLVVDVFNPPIVDHLAMIRNNSVQVTAAFAVHEINKYVKSRDPSVKIVEGKAKASQLLNNDPAQVYDHIFKSNAVSRVTGGLVFNCMENKITVTAKKGSSSHRFYAMTGLIPNEEALGGYRAAVAAFHAATPDSDEARRLHAELEQHAERFSVELKKPAGASELFTHDPELDSYGVQPTVVIWAISRELDHVVDVEYTNEAYSLEAVRKRSAFITSLNEEKLRKLAPPSPIPIADTPSLDMDAMTAPDPVEEESVAASSAPVEDDMNELVTEEKPKGGRKRREPPTSPGKRNAVKKDRIR